MTKQRLSDGTVNFLRRAAVILGCVFLLVAALADPLGLSVGQGLSRNQIAFGIVGLLLILAGATGRLFYKLYRSFAVLLLNVIVIIIIVDFLSLAIVKVFDAERLNRRADHLNQGGDIATERRTLVSVNYSPWVLWRSNPPQGGEENGMDCEGRRITPFSSEDPEALSLFALGGSAMWGTGATDSCTIPALLCRDLTLMLDQPVSMRNLAQVAFVSTQDVIELILELRVGHVPDVVVFYDGFNDVLATYSTGIPGVHLTYAAIADRLEGRETGLQETHPFLTPFRSTNIWLLITMLRDKFGLDHQAGLESLVTYRTMGLDSDSLAREVVNIYLENCSLVEHLGEAYGFQCLFVWQPVIWCGNKSPTEYEEQVLRGDFPEFPEGGDPAFHDLLNTSYDLFIQERPDTLRYLCLQHLFDESTEQVYIDAPGCHVTQEANAVISSVIAARILTLIPTVLPPEDMQPSNSTAGAF